MDVTSLASSLTGAAAGRARLEANTAILDKVLDTSSEAALSLVAAMSQTVPAGLTYSPSGLSPERSNRFIATL